MGSSREITWQEFRTAFLDKGLVDKLVGVNRQKVRIKFHSNATGQMYPATALAGGEYYFSIGSVDAFERKLDKAQKELGIPSHERIPVAYYDKISALGMALNFAPTIFFAGLLLYMSHCAGGKLVVVPAVFSASERAGHVCSTRTWTSVSSSRMSPAWMKPRKNHGVHQVPEGTTVLQETGSEDPLCCHPLWSPWYGQDSTCKGDCW